MICVFDRNSPNNTDTHRQERTPSTKSREFAALDGKLRQSLHEFGECDGEHLARPRFQRAIRGLGELLEDLHDLLNHRLALIQTEILRIALHGRLVDEKHGQERPRQIPLQRRLCEEQDIEELLDDSTHITDVVDAYKYQKSFSDWMNSTRRRQI